MAESVGGTGGRMDVNTNGLTHGPALTRVAIGAAAGACAAILDAVLGPTDAAPLVGWDTLALVYLGLPQQTARRAIRHDRTRAISSVLLLVAAVASLVAVGAVLLGAGRTKGTVELRVGFGVASVVVSWAMVHTVFTLRYATTYYSHPTGAINFNQSDPPT